MSNVLSRMSAKTFRATLGNQKVTIQVATSYGLANYVSDEQLEKIEERFTKKADYFISANEVNAGFTVYKMSEGYKGHHDEYAEEDYEVVGTLMGKPRSFRIETDLKEVERVRRQYQVVKMEKGQYTVGAPIDAEGNVVGEPIGNDVSKLKDSWAEKDATDGAGMHCRGHGLYVESVYLDMLA
ncbi:hypothetical protein [Vibrio crassostreae]|uniref:hypothetical protein n=1 Tax=Vibrio crassostreae TaxID=246167 RepID=UPI001B3047B7|nr:hypothetical protein [Vibrio crassostreae]